MYDTLNNNAPFIPAGGRVVAVAQPETGVSPLQQAHRDALVTVALEEIVRVLLTRNRPRDQETKSKPGHTY